MDRVCTVLTSSFYCYRLLLPQLLGRRRPGSQVWRRGRRQCSSSCRHLLCRIRLRPGQKVNISLGDHLLLCIWCR